MGSQIKEETPIMGLDNTVTAWNSLVVRAAFHQPTEITGKHFKMKHTLALNKIYVYYNSLNVKKRRLKWWFIYSRKSGLLITIIIILCHTDQYLLSVF